MGRSFDCNDAPTPTALSIEGSDAAPQRRLVCPAVCCCRCRAPVPGELFARKHSIFDVHDPVSKFEDARIVRHHKNGTTSLLSNGGEYRRDGVPVGGVE